MRILRPRVRNERPYSIESRFYTRQHGHPVYHAYASFDSRGAAQAAARQLGRDARVVFTPIHRYARRRCAICQTLL